MAKEISSVILSKHILVVYNIYMCLEYSNVPSFGHRFRPLIEKDIFCKDGHDNCLWNMNKQFYAPQKPKNQNILQPFFSCFHNLVSLLKVGLYRKPNASVLTN